MKAVGKYIVIFAEDEKGITTKNGLILDEANREDIRYRKATVINTGDEVKEIKEGDSIYYDWHAGFKVELGEKVFTVIKEFDVVIVL